jgi:hypothetical protein
MQKGNGCACAKATMAQPLFEACINGFCEVSASDAVGHVQYNQRTRKTRHQAEGAHVTHNDGVLLTTIVKIWPFKPDCHTLALIIFLRTLCCKGFD